MTLTKELWQAAFAKEVRAVTDELAELLIEKNGQYGDSALNPVRIFSHANTTEQIHVRIDDKLSRLSRGSEAGEDVIKDLLGYLVLLRIATRREAAAKTKTNAAFDILQGEQDHGQKRSSHQGYCSSLPRSQQGVLSDPGRLQPDALGRG